MSEFIPEELGQMHRELPAVRSILFSSNEIGFRFPRRTESSTSGESLDDRIAKAQLVAALKQSLRSTRAAKNLIVAQLAFERGSEHGISETAIVLLETDSYLDKNITNLNVLLSACGVVMNPDEYLGYENHHRKVAPAYS